MSESEPDQIHEVAQPIKSNIFDERPFVERLWDNCDTTFKVGMATAIVLGVTSYALSYGGSNEVIYPQLHDVSIWAARATLGLLTLYATSRTVRWLILTHIEEFQNAHLSSDIWHHNKRE